MTTGAVRLVILLLSLAIVAPLSLGAPLLSTEPGADTAHPAVDLCEFEDEEEGETWGT